jgi:serine/threonine protein kinase/formylglycine-generating enzyme required for sulfatase activity
MARTVEGAALLVAGHGAIGGTALDASAVHSLGQIGEALLATGAGWQLRRLSAAAGERLRADRGSIKHYLDELVAEPVRVAVLVVLGVVADAGGPALVTSSQLREYPEDATLPLAWIGERLRQIRAEQLLVVVSARRDPSFAASAGAELSSGSPVAWLDALRTGRPHDLIAVDSPSAGAPLVAALLDGIFGEALDSTTGTVTMKSLSQHLARSVPTAALQASDASHTLTHSPPLAGLWDLGRSQSIRSRPRAPAAADDLSGLVLPGRFRIDSVLARGTFGTVYRARQLSVERDVAVKVLHSDIDPLSQDGRLFVQEIRAVGRIDHANVVRIYQADIARDGRLFYAMELLEGHDLQQLAAAGPLRRARAIELVRQLLIGLAAAHDAGLVHADVKPANAIVVPRGDGERVVLVDFGLARLRAHDHPAVSAGGTPAYMAPEQLQDGRVDARSDVFSAALVLVTLLTGWRRPNSFTLIPSLDAIDADLREILKKALALEPANRYATARELAAALTGTVAPPTTRPPPVLPFRLFAPLSEHDHERLHGRETDLASLSEYVLYGRSVIYTAPSGTGKTSLLRAGLVPRLEALGVHPVYLRARTSQQEQLASAIWPGATAIAEAVTQHARQRGNRLVIVIDQIEAALATDELVREVLRLPAEADVAIVLSIREDHLARLIARTQRYEAAIPVLSLPPLDLAGARDAIVGPLTEARIAIEPDLLDVLLADLRKAAAAIAPEMGWTDANAVYPPHLQLACSGLYEALEPGTSTLTLAHYRKLGGFEAIVGEHLERVLDVELADGRDAIARDVFTALVTTAHQRAVRPESELLAMVKHERNHTLAVLDILRARGLVLRVRGDAEPSWELVHDSLIPRIFAWIDRRDLARRRAIELVRYHLRRSHPNEPSLLGRSELREVRDHTAAIAELDAEWKGREDAILPSELVARSRQALRRRRLTIGSVLGAALAVAATALVFDVRAEARAREEQSLRDRDIGKFTLELAPFDWDPAHLRAIPVPASELNLQWELHLPDPKDRDSMGEIYPSRLLEHGERNLGATLREQIETRGGEAYLVVRGRGRKGETCAPSIVPLQHLPGYIQRADAPTVRIAMPTCQATLADTILIAAGPFISGGVGDPPTPLVADFPELAIEHEVTLAAYRIDRTEVTNAAFEQLAQSSSWTGIAMPAYPPTKGLEHAADADHPAAGMTWPEARAYCRFMGKQLPTAEQWQRALRGGLRLANGDLNPMPRRNLPWGAPRTPFPAKIVGIGVEGTAAVGTYPDDRSPDGILDLAGNVGEWNDTIDPDGYRDISGGNWYWTRLDNVLSFVGPPNQRFASFRDFALGARCVVSSDGSRR